MNVGSKTPLAYADLFYITTVYDKIEYSYILHKGESKPTLELLAQEETEAHNGTTIKINIKANRGTYNDNDVLKFQKELQFQLAYFDSVYFRDWAISNDYDIYEGDYFKFRSDIEQSQTAIHICIGKVRYPIDFSKVNIDSKYVKIPVAVKFDIGELQITPSRESLRYDDKGVALIQERVELAVQEILGLFEKQNPVIEDLKTYEAIKVQTPRVTFNADKNHVLNMWSASRLSKNFVFKPLVGLNIKKIPANFFFMWKCTGYLTGEVFRSFNEHEEEANSNNNRVNNKFVLENKYVILGKDDRISSYANIYIRRRFGSYSNVYFIKKKELDFDLITKTLGIKETKTVGKAKTIMEYMKVINKIVYDNGQLYEDLRPTDEWIADYKRSIIESTLAYQRKKNQRIFVRDIGAGSQGREMKVTELQNRTGILIYGFREDKAVLQRIFQVVSANKQSVKAKSYERRNKAFMVLQISRNVEKDLLGGKKTIYWDKFFKTKFFKKMVTHREIHSRLQGLQLEGLSYRKQFIRGFKEEYEAIKKSVVDYSPSAYCFNLRDEDYDEETSIIRSMLKPVEDFKKKYCFDIPLISALSSLHDDNIKEYADYLKYKGFKLRSEFYLKDASQLKYEAGLRQIFMTFRCPQNNLLTYNLNLQDNGNENISNSEENRKEHSSDNRPEEIQQISYEGGDRLDNEESRNVQQEAYRNVEESDNQADVSC